MPTSDSHVTPDTQGCKPGTPMADSLVFFVNGKQYTLVNPDPETTLLQFLRKECLTGTKLGCGEGGCGACTVMVSGCCPDTSVVHHWSVNACLAPLCSLHGLAVTTVEGVGSLRTRLHPVQTRIAEAHGIQCGFCTPGMVMSMYALLRNSPTPSLQQVEAALDGNLCRCTGYRPILDGYKTFAKGCCQQGQNCCQNLRIKSSTSLSSATPDTITLSSSSPGTGNVLSKHCSKESFPGDSNSENRLCNGNLSQSHTLVDTECTSDDSLLQSGLPQDGMPVKILPQNGPSVNNTMSKVSMCTCGQQKTGPNEETPPNQKLLYDPTQEPIFPTYLKLEGKHLNNQSLQFSGPHVTWYRPTSLQQLLSIKKQNPDCKIVIGNTEIGIETKFKGQLYPVLIAATHVPELMSVRRVEQGIQFGASVTMNTVEHTLKNAVNTLPEWQTRIFAGFVEMLRWFAGQQIRNVACLGGNVMTASPISDLNPLLLACGAVLELMNTDGTTRHVQMDSTFFHGYRKIAVDTASEILISVLIPYSSKDEYFNSYKQSNRKDDDIAIVNAGMRVVLDLQGKVKDLALAFGGMAPITVMATNTMKQLIGLPWNKETLELGCDLLNHDLPLDPGAPGGTVGYRRSLTLSFFYKFFLTVLRQMHQQGILADVPLPLKEMSATLPLERGLVEGSQWYESSPDTQSPHDALRQPLVQDSAYHQATGEAIYVDDIPPKEDELYLAFVLSTKARARLMSVDASTALAMPGVVDFITHTDVPASSTWGFGKEEVFASEEVLHQGQVIGAILAESQSKAQRAAQAVCVKYDVMEPVITIKDAITKNSFFDFHPVITRGDTDNAWATCGDNIVQGELHIEAQEHFYLETNACLAFPGEPGEIEVIATTQGPGILQEELASVLGMQSNQIICRVKRIGGGFGGKENRSCVVTLPVAIASHKHGRAVRCSLDRNEDMKMMGTRHPYFATYKAGFTTEGKLVAVEMEFFSNAGCSTDRTFKVLEKTLLASDNTYMIPNITLKGHCCKTNLPSCTGFRGFGAPQGMLVMETLITHIASRLNVPPEKVREINLYQEGNITHYHQVLEQCNIRRCWADCVQQSQYHSRREQVQNFNRQNRWNKRGIAVVPTKFGISFTAAAFNYGGALVNIYTDGSVLVSHGGVEMGQGLHIKMIQVASRALGVPASKIRIGETSTPTTPNANATAGSLSSDLYGAAVLDACNVLLQRLQPLRESHPEASWQQLIAMAHIQRINLQATGFYKTPDIGYDITTNSGRPFAYFSFGVACSEVEIDCLTGDHQVLRTDIVMDVGKSLNPAIDIGQIEGGFMQGYGLMVLEQYKVRPDGTLLTCGPSNYKIPSVANIPQQLHVSLLRESGNPKAVYSSKGIGEPPLFLAASVLFAIKEAVTSARLDADLDPFFRLDTPATPSQIRMACGDHLTSKIEASTVHKPNTEPWFVEL